MCGVCVCVCAHVCVCVCGHVCMHVHDRLMQKGMFHRAERVVRKKDKGDKPDKGDKAKKKKVKDTAAEKDEAGTGGDELRVNY